MTIQHSHDTTFKEAAECAEDTARWLHFAWVVDDAKCILVTRVCVCLSTAACPHYCMDLDVTWRNGRGCRLVVHYWVDLQSVQGFRWYDNIVQSVRGFHCNDSTVANAKCQRVLVLPLCLVFRNWPLFNPAKMVTVLYGTKAQHEKTARTVVLFCNNVKLLGTALGSNNRLACHWSSTYLQL